MTSDSASTRQLVHFRGNVQGVGFRATTRHIAVRFDVAGTVRNLADGSVEVVAEGADDEVKAFIAEVQRVLGRHISEALVDTMPASNGEFKGFRIRY